MLEHLFLLKDTTTYKMAKELNVPYTAINRIVKGTTDLNNVKIKVLAELSEFLSVSTDELYKEYYIDKYIKESEWNTYISNIQHKIKEDGKILFMKYCISNQLVERCFLMKQYDKGLYTIATIDYLCRTLNITLYDGYKEFRKFKLENPKYPSDIELISDDKFKTKLKNKCLKECIPEFKRFNIIEKGVENAI